MATTGMELTFDMLASAHNAAADELLALAIESSDSAVRRRGITAVLRRRGETGPRRILQMWYDLNDAELRAVQDHPTAMAGAVKEALLNQASDPMWLTALDAVRMLSLDELLPTIIDRLEASLDHKTRRHALAVVMEMSDALGTAAREGRGRPSVREPVLRRLAEAVRRIAFHRNEELCEAFLAVSNWGDRELRHLMEEESEGQRYIERSLLTSTLPGVLQLLAGFLRRKRIPDVVRHAIETRADDLFRTALLRVIGTEPTPLSLRQLHEFPLVAAFREADLVLRVPPVHHAALAHAYTANAKSDVDRVAMLIDLIVSGHHESEAAIAIALAHCPVLDASMLFRAARARAGEPVKLPPVGLQYQEIIERALPLFDHPCRSIVLGLRRVLAGLSVPELLAVIEDLPDPYMVGVGSVVRRIDDEAASRLTDELRSPIIHRRLRAIKAIVACDLVRKLEAALTLIAKQDYREVRIEALQALSQGNAAASLAAIEDAAAGPDGTQRDVALEALYERLAEAELAPVEQSVENGEL